MFLKKSTLTIAMTALLTLLALDACAQWSPGGTVVYMGDLNLAGSFGTSGGGTYAIGGSGVLGGPGSSAANDVSANGSYLNDTPLNNTPLNNTSMNNTSLNDSSIDNASANSAPMNAATLDEQRKIAVMDLSGYAKNRVEGNLAGYTNIMYPIAGLSTVSTAGGGGGGGCGCG